MPLIVPLIRLAGCAGPPDFEHRGVESGATLGDMTLAAQPEEIDIQKTPSATPPRGPGDDLRREADASLAKWLASTLGRDVTAAENALLAKLMPQLYAPIAVHLSPSAAGSASESVLRHVRSAVSVRVVPDESPSTNVPADETSTVDDEPEDQHRLEHVVVASGGALPFTANSVDLMVMSHTLDRADDPHQVLREINQIIAPEGHVIIVGFNPVSLWGLRRLISGWRGRYPWTAQFLRLSRIKDWLRLLNFDIVSGRMCYYGPPIHHHKVRRRLAFLERSGQRWWPGLGAAYIIVAKKRDPGFTLVGKLAPHKRTMGVRLATPVARRVLKARTRQS